VRVDAVYPENAGRHEMDVVLFDTVDVDGRVSDVSVAQSGGPQFDNAAITAIRQWRFVPARQGATPIRARIRVLFHFDPPAPPAPSAEPVAEPAPAPALVTVQREEQAEVRVRGRSHLPSRGAGDYEIPVGKLALVPRADAASLLRLAPGTFLLNQGGTGAPVIKFSSAASMRARARTSSFTADGTPINEVGNVHGSGSPTRTSSSRSSFGACASSRGRSHRSRATSRSRGLRCTTSGSMRPVFP
jgi:TonB family protein